jgi:hypothetical protein
MTRKKRGTLVRIAHVGLGSIEREKVLSLERERERERGANT